MREAEFRAWLDQRKWKGKPLTHNAKSGRVSRCNLVERGLRELGFVQSDLDSVFSDGQWDALITALKDLTPDQATPFIKAGSPVPLADPFKKQLSSLANAVRLYGFYREGRDPNLDDANDKPDSSDPPFVLYDAEGNEYQPVKIENQITEISAFRLQKPGTSNKTKDSEEVEAIADVARAVLLKGRLARITRIGESGKKTNYIGYGKGKLVRYRLDPDLARQIGVPEEGEADNANVGTSNHQKGIEAMPSPTNLILYGPPGTGKTYNTALEAVVLCDGEAARAELGKDRAKLMKRYNELQRQGRVGFVTFHQNYGYEDFVEGLRPQQSEKDNEGGGNTGFSLVPRDGIFLQMARVAGENRGSAIPTGLLPMDRSRKIFKMSLGRSWASEDDAIFENALEGDYVVLGWGGDVDWSEAKYTGAAEIRKRWQQFDPQANGSNPNISQIYTFRAKMEKGSIVIVSDGNLKVRAIAEITGDYQFRPSPDGEYNHRRPVRWLWHSREGLPRERIYRKSLSQVSTYQMDSGLVEWEALGQIISGSGDATETSGEPESYVLIIDEINRANVSKVFGELITLIEPDKRKGMENALSVTLPYSGDTFSVPANLHIIGTMNTADRSIALLDTALRRRFLFREMAPQPELLGVVDEINLGAVLTTINQRIEYLLDREHRIGHAFFMGCETREDVHEIMRHMVIPLLQEYFFEDWSRVAAVLGKEFIEEIKLDPPPNVDGDKKPSWSVRESFGPEAYKSLISYTPATTQEA